MPSRLWRGAVKEDSSVCAIERYLAVMAFIGVLFECESESVLLFMRSVYRLCVRWSV